MIDLAQNLLARFNVEGINVKGYAFDEARAPKAEPTQDVATTSESAL